MVIKKTCTTTGTAYFSSWSPFFAWISEGASLVLSSRFFLNSSKIFTTFSWPKVLASSIGRFPHLIQEKNESVLVNIIYLTCLWDRSELHIFQLKIKHTGYTPQLQPNGELSDRHNRIMTCSFQTVGTWKYNLFLNQAKNNSIPSQSSQISASCWKKQIDYA